jgi:hypothetical protein
MTYRNQRPPLFLPVILIAIGALFLYANFHPNFYPWPLIRTYWPLLLIFFGVGKILDSTWMRRSGDPNAQPGPSIAGTVTILALVLVLMALFWHGRAFSRDGRHGVALHHESRIVEVQDAKSVDASIEAGSGEVNISGGSSHLLDADFNFADSYSTPTVDYNVASGVGQLTINQNGEDAHFISSHNDWNLRFSNDVPLELKLDMGAGQGRLRLRDVPVTRLELNMGAGQVDLDLTGDRKKDLDADIEGGVGQATIRLPKNVGVVVHATGGIGAVHALGFTHNDDEYTNEAYGKTPATIRLKVEGGVGEISLIQEP